MSDQPPVPFPSFLKLMTGSTARHVLAGVAGGLVTKGVLTATQGTELQDVGGALAIFAASLVWAAMQHKKNAPK